MKTLLNTILLLAYLDLIIIAWFIPDKLGWKIAFTAFLLFAGWIYICLKNAPTYPDDY